MYSFLVLIMVALADNNSNDIKEHSCGLLLKFTNGSFKSKISIHGTEVDVSEDSKFVFKRFHLDLSSKTKINNAQGTIIFDLENSDDDKLMISQLEDDSIKIAAFAIKDPKLPKDPEFDIREFKRIGHRGSGKSSYENNKFVENTVESFLNAKKNGAQMVELDVHLSKDGVVVVYHNDKIGDNFINDITYEEFLEKANKELGRSDPDGTFTNFEYILNSLPEDLGINVEIKHEGFDSNKVDAIEYINELITGTLKLTKCHKNKFFYTSFDPTVCTMLKVVDCSLKVGFLICDDIFDRISEKYLNRALESFNKNINVDAYIMDTEFYYDFNEYARTIFGFNKPVLCYGNDTNDPESTKKLVSHGFSGLIGDDMEVLSKVL